MEIVKNQLNIFRIQSFRMTAKKPYGLIWKSLWQKKIYETYSSQNVHMKLKKSIVKETRIGLVA